MDLTTAKVLQEVGKALLKIIIFLIPTGIGFGIGWPIHYLISEHNNIFWAISGIICINFYCFIFLVLFLKQSSKKPITQQGQVFNEDNVASRWVVC